MNVFTAVARIGKDPEQRYSANGDSIVSFNGAVDSGFGDKKVTTWIKYTLWGKRGESVLPYLAKGNQVAVSGELTNRKWQDKEGQDRYSLEVRVNEITLIGGKSDKSTCTNTTASRKPKFDGLEDQIPF